MRQIKKIILYGVVIFASVIAILYIRHSLSYDLNAAEKGHKHYTSKVNAYQFDSRYKDTIQLKNGTQFEQNNLSIGDSNYDVKDPYKLNQRTVESKPTITYVKITNKTNSQPHYYILKID